MLDMKILYWIIGIIIVLIGGFYLLNNYTKEENRTEREEETLVQVEPVTHASAILHWGESVIYTDPTGGAVAYESKAPANIVLVTDIHGDHLSTSTLSSVVKGNTVLIVPQAVEDLLPSSLASTSRVLRNGETITVNGFNISAIPMYNLPESADSRHTKGRGNGYVIERDDTRVYIAGDTSGIPEMRALENIDIALVPMNPPFTMTVEEAADAVLDFAPRNVYPFHYRGQNGLSDTNQFKNLVTAGNPNINVVLLNWYPGN